MVETLKSSFLFNFRTGNVMIDTFVTGLIIMISTYLFNLSQQIITGSWDLSWLAKWYKKKTKSKIIISGRKLQGADNTRLEYSTNFFAILRQIKKLDSVTSEIRELSEIPIQDPGDVDYRFRENDSDVEKEDTKETVHTRGMGTQLIVSQSEPFKMNDEIFCSVDISKESDNNEKNPMKTEEFQITLSSEVLNTDELRAELFKWVTEYESLLNTDSQKYLKYFLYTPSGDARDDYYDPTTNYSQFKFESGKTFDNVVFPEKKDIIKRIDFFTKNKEWYKKRGIPYTMGFLFYGDPGCGKTSTIKAIANYTQRHIVSVPLNKIRTANELLNLFYNVKMNYTEIPLDQRLYVLEDIDAADLKDVVGERSGDNEDKVDDSESEAGLDKNLLALIKTSGPLGKLQSNKLTLASLLEVLDGVMEMDGRMLIITTNYPERLDKALIRPGRIDLKVKFSPCTADSIVEMYHHYFDTEIPEKFDKESLPDLKWTPAEVTQVFLNNMYDPVKGLEELVSSVKLEKIHIMETNEKEIICEDNNKKVNNDEKEIEIEEPGEE